MYTSPLQTYYGIERYFSWTLTLVDSEECKRLNKTAFDSWFSCGGQFETVPNVQYIEQYILQCKDNSIPAIVLKLETADAADFVADELPTEKILGFDCLLGVGLSLLNISHEYMIEHFPMCSTKLNKYGLFDLFEDAEEYIIQYKRLVDAGEELEFGDYPLPVRLSVVKLK